MTVNEEHFSECSTDLTMLVFNNFFTDLLSAHLVVLKEPQDEFHFLLMYSLLTVAFFNLNANFSNFCRIIFW